MEKYYKFAKSICNILKIGYTINMLNIIVAPREYNFKAEKRAKKIVKHLKREQVQYSVYFSQTYDSIKESVRELVSFGESEFIVVGDDAVISTILSCFKDIHKIKIGIVPTSKNDDFARYLGISHKPTQAIKDILLKHVEDVDILVVNDMPVLNTVRVGASVEISHRFSQYKVKNFISEKYATAKYGNNFQGIELNIENKNKGKKETVFDLVVANGGFSKGKPVSPLSNLQDGLFNVNYSLISTKSEKKKYIKMQNKGEHIYDDETKQYWMNNLRITNPEKKIKALIDGKIHNVEELNVAIIENGLKIYKHP